MDGTQASAFFIAEEGACLPFSFAGSLLAMAVVAGPQGDLDIPAQHFYTAL
jgi:hypothetical protein